MTRLTTDEWKIISNAILTYLFPPASAIRYGKILTGFYKKDPSAGHRLHLKNGDFACRLSRMFLPILKSWFRYDIEGLENIPTHACLLVGNHNGGLQPVDSVITAGEISLKLGPDVPFFALVHDYLFKEPSFTAILEKVGGVKACSTNATQAFKLDAPVLVYPGGDIDTFKPWKDRNSMYLGHRRGFIKLALENHVNILPVASIGAHEVWYVISRGTQIAKLLNFHKHLRTDTFPIVVSLPWGITSGFFPYIPLPSKIKIRIGQELDLSQWYGKTDPDSVEEAYQVFDNEMKTMLDSLSAERKFPVIG